MKQFNEKISNTDKNGNTLQEQFKAFTETSLTTSYSLLSSPSKDIEDSIVAAYKACFGQCPETSVTIGDYLYITINGWQRIKKNEDDNTFKRVRLETSRIIMENFYHTKKNFPLLKSILNTSINTFCKEFKIPFPSYIPNLNDSKDRKMNIMEDLLNWGIKKTESPWKPYEISSKNYSTETIYGYMILTDLLIMFIRAYMGMAYPTEKNLLEVVTC